MNRPDVDDVITYLSTKFKKIFCDRDFVCCVIEDFQTILDNKDRTCILVFPTLGPTYLKALRYQARIFDLAVFNITSPSGRFRSIAVCHKDHLKKPSHPKEEIMPESSASSASVRRKRPERQLYVPPAQRASRLTTKCDKKVTQEAVKNHDCQKVAKKDFQSKNQCSSDEKCVLLNLCDFVNLFHYFDPFLCNFRNSQKNHYQHQNCEFKRLLSFRKFNSQFRYDNFIKIYDSLPVLTNIYYKLTHFKCLSHQIQGYKSYPIFDFSQVTDLPEKSAAVLVYNEVCHFDKSMTGLEEVESSVYKVECDKSCDDNKSYILDLSVLELGHFFIISVEEDDYFYECQQNHDATLCYANVKRELEADRKVRNMNISAIKNQTEQKIEIVNENQRSDIEIDKNGSNETSPKNKTENVKNKINVNKKKVSDNKHEQEKEIMRMTKEYINRKTRPIMKYVDDDDTLKIDKDDSVNNWEDLFDDDGQIQEELLSEIVDKVGDDITIVKASEDYTAYTIKPPEDLEHVVELYNFPASLETHDLVQAFSDINSDAMYIKWVDDTHALLVLGSLSQAQKAISMRNPLIKVRPMTAASAISMDVANKSDLKPAMKRPPTNLQTARRLITTHLGTKSKLSKEQIAKEKQDLKDAREMKRLIKQNEKDAWEGNIRSTIN